MNFRNLLFIYCFVFANNSYRNDKSVDFHLQCKALLSKMATIAYMYFYNVCPNVNNELMNCLNLISSYKNQIEKVYQQRLKK